MVLKTFCNKCLVDALIVKQLLILKYNSAPEAIFYSSSHSKFETCFKRSAAVALRKP